ncbi:TRAP transporter small permease [Limnohabitans sp.]|uniref:TRAP transporter small permease n=1 Tax=Limnohabitans sp. TaxID=1907725 RepID=UPI0037C0D36F
MKKLLLLIDGLLSFLLVVTLLLLLVPVSLQIFSRYTDFIPRYMWTEEMSRFFFIWLIMLGATLGVREKMHFDVDFLPQLSAKANRFLLFICQFFMLVFSGVIFYWGIEFTQFGWNQTSELADMPMWWIFIAWPISGFLWIVFLLHHMFTASSGDESVNQESVV